MSLKGILALPGEEKVVRGLLHTPAEIAQQPDTWQVTWTQFTRQRSELSRFLDQPRRESWPVFLIGAGTSDYIGRSLAPLLRRAWGCEVIVAASTELLTDREELVRPDCDALWISFSRSGESPEGVAVLEQALIEQDCS